jgi:hypothetical protein
MEVEITDGQVSIFRLSPTHPHLRNDRVVLTLGEAEEVVGLLAEAVEAALGRPLRVSPGIEGFSPIQARPETPKPPARRPGILPKTAKDWQLLQLDEAAAQDLTAALKRTVIVMLKRIRKYDLLTPTQVRVAMNLAFESDMVPAMHKHRSLGAYDTEPRAIAWGILIDEAKRARGWTEKTAELGEL